MTFRKPVAGCWTGWTLAVARILCIYARKQLQLFLGGSYFCQLDFRPLLHMRPPPNFLVWSVHLSLVPAPQPKATLSVRKSSATTCKFLAVVLLSLLQQYKFHLLLNVLYVLLLSLLRYNTKPLSFASLLQGLWRCVSVPCDKPLCGWSGLPRGWGYSHNGRGISLLCTAIVACPVHRVQKCLQVHSDWGIGRLPLTIVEYSDEWGNALWLAWWITKQIVYNPWPVCLQSMLLYVEFNSASASAHVYRHRSQAHEMFVDQSISIPSGNGFSSCHYTAISVSLWTMQETNTCFRVLSSWHDTLS